MLFSQYTNFSIGYLLSSKEESYWDHPRVKRGSHWHSLRSKVGILHHLRLHTTQDQWNISAYALDTMVRTRKSNSPIYASLLKILSIYLCVRRKHLRLTTINHLYFTTLSVCHSLHAHMTILSAHYALF